MTDAYLMELIDGPNARTRALDTFVTARDKQTASVLIEKFIWGLCGERPGLCHGDADAANLDMTQWISDTFALDKGDSCFKHVQ